MSEQTHRDAAIEEYCDEVADGLRERLKTMHSKGYYSGFIDGEKAGYLAAKTELQQKPPTSGTDEWSVKVQELRASSDPARPAECECGHVAHEGRDCDVCRHWDYKPCPGYRPKGQQEKQDDE
jgi:hypothetical protein